MSRPDSSCRVRAEFTVGGETQVLRTGDYYLIPGGVPHSVRQLAGPAVLHGHLQSPARRVSVAVSYRRLAISGQRSASALWDVPALPSRGPINGRMLLSSS